MPREGEKMISCMDDEIGKVFAALREKRMLENTLVIFQSDNGGPRSAKFTGEVDMSESTIPADNGPYRDGKGMLYEGGIRVVALANWQGRIKPGSVVDQPIHMVDMLAREAAPSLFLKEVAGVSKRELFGSVALPGDEKEIEMEP